MTNGGSPRPAGLMIAFVFEKCRLVASGELRKDKSELKWMLCNDVKRIGIEEVQRNKV